MLRLKNSDRPKNYFRSKTYFDHKFYSWLQTRFGAKTHVCPKNVFMLKNFYDQAINIQKIITNHLVRVAIFVYFDTCEIGGSSKSNTLGAIRATSQIWEDEE